MEDKKSECASSLNTLVNAHANNGHDISWLKAKVAGLEDSARCNNIKLQGILDTVQPA